MSNDSSSSLPPSFTQPTYSWKIQNFTTPPGPAVPGALETTWHASASTASQKNGEKESLKTENAQASGSAATEIKGQGIGKTPVQKRRKLNPDDEEIRKRTASAIALSLTTDHILALYPDADTPFVDEIDVVNRLLPYHVFQYPKDDLNAMMSNGKGKGKATPEDELREELRETKFAIACHKRYRSLEKRFYNARIRAGEYPSPHDQTIHLERMVAEGDRAAKTFLEQDLSAAKSEHDKQLRAKRAAAQAASRQAALAQAAQAAAHLTANASNSAPTAGFYGYSSKPVMSSLPGTSFSHYYSSYSYPYSQAIPYASSYQLNPGLARNPTPVSTLQPVTGALGSLQTSTSTTTAAPTASISTSATQAIASTTNTASTTSIPQPTLSSTRPPVNIPLQIPVTSLPALRALGIMPVPKAALPPSSEPQPAAVLIGSMAGGTMLSIEVNAALLQASQMSGLAILLSGLVQTGGSSTATAAASTPTTIPASNTAATATSSQCSTDASTKKA